MYIARSFICWLQQIYYKSFVSCKARKSNVTNYFVKRLVTREAAKITNVLLVLLIIFISSACHVNCKKWSFDNIWAVSLKWLCSAVKYNLQEHYDAPCIENCSFPYILSGVEFAITSEVRWNEVYEVKFCNTKRPPDPYLWSHGSARITLHRIDDISNVELQTFLLTYRAFKIDLNAPLFPASFESNTRKINTVDNIILWNNEFAWPTQIDV